MLRFAQALTYAVLIGSLLMLVACTIVQFTPVLWPLAGSVLYHACMVVLLRHNWRVFSNPSTIILQPEGLAFGGYAPVDPIPWRELGGPQEATFLAAPIVRVPIRDLSGLRRRLGKRGRFLRQHSIAGGLYLPARLFGMSPKELIAQIEDYRRLHDDWSHHSQSAL